MLQIQQLSLRFELHSLYGLVPSYSFTYVR